MSLKKMAAQQSQNAKVTLYWLNRSRSQRIVWLLEECKGLDYDVKLYRRTKEQLAPPELTKIHPLGKSPVISVEAPGSTTPIVLAESAFITEYLCDYFGQHLIPKRYQDGKEGQIGGETEQWLRYRYYMHYAEGSLMTLLLVAYLVEMIKNGPSIPFYIKPITRRVGEGVENAFLNKAMATHFAFLESQIASSPDGGKYLCGKDLTAADILMSFPLIAGRAKIDRTKYPKLSAYTDMLEKSDGYVRSTKKIEEISGGSFDAKL